ncbi:MAG: hypothetical protein GY866_29015 [Proteobacteria bacterium]|nr:hypothetical protein [Pseudomonadota bacterium]
MLFKKNTRYHEAILKRAMQEIEKMLLDLEKEGKDLALMKLRKYQKTHHISCVCPKCTKANKKNNPRMRGLREYGFKVFVAEGDYEELDDMEYEFPE